MNYVRVIVGAKRVGRDLIYTHRSNHHLLRPCHSLPDSIFKGLASLLVAIFHNNQRSLLQLRAKQVVVWLFLIDLTLAHPLRPYVNSRKGD